MDIEQVVHRIGEVGIVPVVRAASVEEANRAVDAIWAGGIPILEITMTVPNALAVIRGIAHRCGDDVLVGAGTVTSATQAEECLEAGARFLVSPGTSVAVMDTARKHDKLAIPGVLTPTEVMAAREYGAKLIKIFPCGNVGGAKYLKSLRAPFPTALFIPTGGVNAANAAEYIAAGAFAIGVGADLVDAQALREGNLKKISAAARELVQAVATTRAACRG